jgi:nucleotide-binding universal stress UspA family protein
MRLHQSEAVTPALRRILVPSHGSPVAEHALPHAAECATAVAGRLIFVRIANCSYWNQMWVEPSALWAHNCA